MYSRKYVLLASMNINKNHSDRIKNSMEEQELYMTILD